MPAKTSIGRDFQDDVLARLMERGQVTTLFLKNRMSLRGRILEFDPYVFLLEPLDGSPPQMVYKSAVVSISGPRQIGPQNRHSGPRPPGDERWGRRPQPPAEPRRDPGAG